MCVCMCVCVCTVVYKLVLAALMDSEQNSLIAQLCTHREYKTFR